MLRIADFTVDHAKVSSRVSALDVMEMKRLLGAKSGNVAGSMVMLLVLTAS